MSGGTTGRALPELLALFAGSLIDPRPTAPQFPDRAPLAECVRTDEAIALLRRAAEASVERASRGVGVIGVLSGGGVDSSGVLALAVQHGRRRGNLRVVPLALHFAGEGDDRPHLAALERWLGVTAVKVTPEQGAPYLRSSFFANGAPVGHPSVAYVRAAIAAAREHGVERILTGFLGDEVLTAPRGALALDASWLRAPRRALTELTTAWQLDVPWTSSPARRVNEMILRPFLRGALPPVLRRAVRLRNLRRGLPYRGPLLDRVLVDVVNAPERAFDRRTPRGRLDAYRHDPRIPEQVEARRQLETLGGISFAEPFLDADFLAQVTRIRPDLLLYGHRDRGLWREAIRGLVPDSVRLRRDKARVEEALTRMVSAAGGADAAFGELAGLEKLEAMGIVDGPLARKEIRAFLREARGPVAYEWGTAWPLMAAEAFARMGAA